MAQNEIDRLTELKEKTEQGFEYSRLPRQEGADDTFFYCVNQWDEGLEQNTTLGYRGVFDMLRKCVRDIMSEIRAAQIQIDFQPINSSRKDGAEFLDGYYRAVDMENSSIEAYTQSTMEAVICGVGGWELYTEYENVTGRDNKQVIRRRPIPNFNNNVFYDPNSSLQDRSDASYVTILTSVTKEYIDELCEENGVDPDECSDASAYNPETSYTFMTQVYYSGAGDKPWLGTTYERELEVEKEHRLRDLFGGEIVLSDEEFKEREDQLIDVGYAYIGVREIERWKVKKTIWTGGTVIYEDYIDCDKIPVVPVFGERYHVEGTEYWEGIVRMAKDPQRLRNYVMSYLADIVSTTHRNTPILDPRQVQGHEWMWQDNGADNNLPYKLLNGVDENGNPLPMGNQPTVTPDQQIPQSLAAVEQMTRLAIEDVANPALPDDIASSDTSGVAVNALRSMVDKQSEIYLSNLKHSKRYDALVFIGFARNILDAPRQVTIEKPDGTRDRVMVQEVFVNPENGEVEYLNDLSNAYFEVYTEIGTSFKSQKDKNMQTLKELLPIVPEKMQQAITFTIVTMADGEDMAPLREYARKELISSGVVDPETEEEKQMFQAMKQNQQPDPNMVLAQAEMAKAQAMQMREQREAMKDQAEVIGGQERIAIDQYNAETSRIKTQIDAERYGAEINLKQQEQRFKVVESAQKRAVDRLRGSAA